MRRVGAGKWNVHRSGGLDPSRQRVTLVWAGEPRISIEFAAPGTLDGTARIDADEIRRQICLAISALQVGLEDPPTGALRPMDQR